MATVDTVVSRGGYAYRGVPLPVGTVVRMTAEQFERTQCIRPPFFREAMPAEVRTANRIINLAEVEPANTVAPETAEGQGAEEATEAPVAETVPQRPAPVRRPPRRPRRPRG